MATTRRQVHFIGIILDGDRPVADCSGVVTEVSPEGMVPAYTGYNITTFSRPLPDGGYTLVAHGSRLSVRLQNGHWFGPP